MGPRSGIWAADILKPGAIITEKRVFPTERGKSPYASVKKQEHQLVLVNLSKDIWVLHTPGEKDRPIDQHESFALAANVTLVLRDKHTLRILLNGLAHQ